MADYIRLKSTKQYLHTLAEDLSIDLSRLVIKVDGYRDSQGTWVHPEVAVDLAHFLGRPFKKWFIESFCSKNYDWIVNVTATELIQNIAAINSISVHVNRDKKLYFEKQVRNRLAEKESGQIEIEIPIGFIDVVTASEIIEVKSFRHWKSAIGQIIAYSIYFPSKKKRIHLFGKIGRTDLKKVAYVCQKLSVNLTYELQDF